MVSSALVRTILHVDIDAFYASAEQSVNSSLRNKSLIVGAETLLENTNLNEMFGNVVKEVTSQVAARKIKIF